MVLGVVVMRLGSYKVSHVDPGGLSLSSWDGVGGRRGQELRASSKRLLLGQKEWASVSKVRQRKGCLPAAPGLSITGC